MSLTASIIIAVVSIYLAHGINARTTVALVSMMIMLGGDMGCPTLRPMDGAYRRRKRDSTTSR